MQDLSRAVHPRGPTGPARQSRGVRGRWSGAGPGRRCRPSRQGSSATAAIAFFTAPASAPQSFVWALRLNHVTTEAGLQDLLALRGVATKPSVVLLPKTESVSEVEIALQHLSDGSAHPMIVTLIESGRGLSAAEAIAAHPAVVALAFGGADLAADLNAELAWESMLFARSRIVQAAAAASIAAWHVPTWTSTMRTAWPARLPPPRRLATSPNSPSTPRRSA
jgi:citrate lyase beta subunit